MQNIKVLDMKKLQVDARVANRSEILFQLNNLKNLLPSVVVKVYLCVCMICFTFLIVDTVLVLSGFVFYIQM